MAVDIFDELNEALFAQMGKLQNAGKFGNTRLDETVKQSRAVALLAEKVIANNNSKIAALRFFEEHDVSVGELEGQRSKLLGDGGHGA